VNNIAPTIEPFGPFTVDEWAPLTILANATDPGSDDLTFTWEWGDGTSDTITVHYNDGIGVDPYPSPNGNFPFIVNDSVEHVYYNPGIYTITLTVADDDGGVAFYSTSVTVNSVPVLPPILYINISYDKEDVVLYWEPPPTPETDHYLIYRSTSQIDFDFTDIWVNTSCDNESGEPGPNPLRTMWNHTMAAYPGGANYEEQYYYVIRAVNTLGKVSTTSRTVGKWTKLFPQGISTFSMPLEPIETLYTDDLTTDMTAEYIKYMDPTSRTWITHNFLDGTTNNVEMKLGEGYEVKFSGQTFYSFTGMPGAMILHDDNSFGFDATPGGEAASVTATVNSTSGTITLNWTQPIDMTSGDQYYVLRSNIRDGFWGISGTDYLVLAILPFNTISYQDVGNATIGTQRYYMIIPVNISTGQKGSSTYSIGVWTEEFLSQYDSFGIPLKMFENHTADWYCNEITDTVGINYFNISLQLWFWHSTRMPPGAFDPELEMTNGYQISTSSITKFHFVGV
jgi:hypothetical protein